VKGQFAENEASNESVENVEQGAHPKQKKKKGKVVPRVRVLRGTDLKS